MLSWLKKKEIPVLSPLDGYQRWAETYSTETNPIKDYSNNRVAQYLPDLKGKSVLDAGCGTGYFCALAEQKGASHIVGVDFSEAMIQHAKKNCKTTEFHREDVTKLPFPPDTFDVVICALVLAHVENISNVFSSFSAFLKTGGTLVLTDFHPELTTRNSKRTFKDSKTKNTFEIKHFLHPLEEIQKLLNTSGLQLQQLEEPQWNSVPIIYALKATKQ